MKKYNSTFLILSALIIFFTPTFSTAETEKKVFVVAYSDIMHTGDYTSPGNVLIAKLVDENNSGKLDPGDKLILGSYPIDLKEHLSRTDFIQFPFSQTATVISTDQGTIPNPNQIYVRAITEAGEEIGVTFQNAKKGDNMDHFKGSDRLLIISRTHKTPAIFLTGKTNSQRRTGPCAFIEIWPPYSHSSEEAKIVPEKGFCENPGDYIYVEFLNPI